MDAIPLGQLSWYRRGGEGGACDLRVQIHWDRVAGTGGGVWRGGCLWLTCANALGQLSSCVLLGTSAGVKSEIRRAVIWFL